MRRNRKTHALSIVLSVGLGIVGLSACGSVDKVKEAAKTAEAIEKAGSAPTMADGSVNPEVDKVVGTMLEQGMGQRGKKTKGVGKGKFLNLVEVNGQPVDIDVWWGQPDEGAKVATIAYGQSSEWVTPMVTKGFSDTANAVYTVTDSKTKAEVTSWDRWEPKKENQLLMMFNTNSEGGVSTTSFDFDPAAKDYMDKVILPAADSGMVRLHWLPIDPVLDGPNDSLRAIREGSKCLTNGTGIAGPDGNQIEGQSFQVAVGAELGLSAEYCGNGPATNVATIKAPPTSGRALMLVYPSADGPKLLIEPAP
jgi:hypothetical protein